MSMTSNEIFKIGIDVGGTHTDAALIACSDTAVRVVSIHKAPTNPAIRKGVFDACSALLSAAAVHPSHIKAVTIGTTAFMNALLERDTTKLERVAVLRLCGPYTRDIPPLVEWPPRLRGCIDGGWAAVGGGLELTGQLITEIDQAEIHSAVKCFGDNGIQNVAIVGVFSPLDGDGGQEYRARDMVLNYAPEMAVCCSRDVGQLGFLERENVTVLNAALKTYAKRLIGEIKAALAKLALPASTALCLTTNSGTLCSAAAAAEFPVRTFTCGPTNSIIGAAILSSHIPNVDAEAIVIDIGGTTTDVGVLQPSGFPRLASSYVEVAGVRVAFSMPDISSIPLGGGSIVEWDLQTEEATIGPHSLGYDICTRSILAGGTTATVTDVVVASGLVDCPTFGRPDRVRDIPKFVIEKVREFVRTTLLTAINFMKASDQRAEVLLVGGGALIVDHQLGMEINPAGKIRRVAYAATANAVGAAHALVEGCVDQVAALRGQDEESIEQAIANKALKLALENGALAGTEHIVGIGKMQLQYIEDKVVHFTIRAVGKPNYRRLLGTSDSRPPKTLQEDFGDPGGRPVGTTGLAESRRTIGEGQQAILSRAPKVNFDPQSYRPEVRDGVWYLTCFDLHILSKGFGFLGCGGGGSAHISLLQTLSLFQSNPRKRLCVVPPTALRPDSLYLLGSYYGAPSVSAERISAARDIIRANEAVLKYSRLEKSVVEGLLSEEIGGGNGFSAFMAALCMEDTLPVVDADTMGRAFPSIEQTMPILGGCTSTPVAIIAGNGTTAIVDNIPNPRSLEIALRSFTASFGYCATISTPPLMGSQVAKHTVHHSVTKAWLIGHALKSEDWLKGLTRTVEGVSVLCRGTIRRVVMQTKDGYDGGELLVTSSPNVDRASIILRLPFKNEFILAAEVKPDGTEKVLCTVPDLISVVDARSGDPIMACECKWGMRVVVIGMRADARWWTTEGQRLAGVGWCGWGLERNFEGVRLAGRDLVNLNSDNFWSLYK